MTPVITPDRGLPRISIVVPCYNNERTILRALGSIRAQTLQDWECVIVDDGSTDGSAQLLDSVGAVDPMFRLVRHTRNQGRGAARATGLATARGEFLAMVDADDWIYPDKLRRQLNVLQSTPTAAVASSSLAVFHDDLSIAGVHEITATHGLAPPLTGPRQPPTPHAPSLIRMDAARAAGFNARFRCSEDTDFMVRLLLKHPYVHLPEPLYAYGEIGSMSRAKYRESDRATLAIFRQYRRTYPVQAHLGLARCAAKSLVREVLFAMGQQHRMISAHARPASLAEVADYQAALASVRSATTTLEAELGGTN